LDKRQLLFLKAEAFFSGGLSPPKKEHLLSELRVPAVRKDLRV